MLFFSWIYALHICSGCCIVPVACTSLVQQSVDVHEAICRGVLQTYSLSWFHVSVFIVHRCSSVSFPRLFKCICALAYYCVSARDCMCVLYEIYVWIVCELYTVYVAVSVVIKFTVLLDVCPFALVYYAFTYICYILSIAAPTLHEHVRTQVISIIS